MQWGYWGSHNLRKTFTQRRGWGVSLKCHQPNRRLTEITLYIDTPPTPQKTFVVGIIIIHQYTNPFYFWTQETVAHWSYVTGHVMWTALTNEMWVEASCITSKLKYLIISAWSSSLLFPTVFIVGTFIDGNDIMIEEPWNVEPAYEDIWTKESHRPQKTYKSNSKSCFCKPLRFWSCF